MKKLVFIFALLISLSLTAQSNYDKAMQNGLTLLKQNKLAAASNLFERIAQTTNDSWLPSYYVAYANVQASFQTKEKSKVDLYIAKAEKYLKQAEEISSNNSEILALKGLFYTAQIAFDPMTNGQKYSAITTAIYTNAVALDSLNPRALSGQLGFQLGYDKFFNKDLSKYCPKYKTILPLFNKKTKGKYMPSWGKERVLYHIKNLCNDEVNLGKSIKITVTGFKNNTGNLKIALYDNKAHFLTEKLLVQTATIQDNKATVIFENIKPGTYAISCYHDANSNKQLDKNSYGMPTEQYAFSNNARGTMGPPTWDDCTFSITANDIEMTLKL